MLQTLLDGATNLYSYLSAFEGIRIPQVQTQNNSECHFFFQMVDGKDGACEFALCIESDMDGGQVAMEYQSDMGVSQLTEEELRKVNSGLGNHLFYERWFDESKEEEDCYKQRIEDALRQIDRTKIAQVIEENEIPYDGKRTGKRSMVQRMWCGRARRR